MSGYACDGCDGGEPAVWLTTNLGNGQTVAVGAGCMVSSLIGMLAVEVGVDAAGLYDAIKRHVDRAARRQADGKTAGKQAAAAADDQPEAVICPGCGQHLQAVDGDLVAVMTAHEGECAPLKALMASEAAGDGNGS